MKLKALYILVLLLLSVSSFGQKPAWTDYYKRIEMYPENEFITGFVSGTASLNDDPAELKAIYESMAKDKVIQSIQVEIETNNSLVISNTNGRSGEEFVSNNVSVAKAEVNGLTTQSYYDRRKKEVFAIATVNRKELAFFYRNKIKSSREDVEQLIIQGKAYVRKNKKEMALKTYYQAMPLLQEIDQARASLIALNRKMYADIDMDEVNRLNLEVNNEITNLLKPNDLTLSEAAYFLAYGIHLQLAANASDLFIDGFYFENTGLHSNFSNKLEQEFTSSLVDAGGYKIRTENGTFKTITITGNYWKEGEFLKISASAYQNEKLIAASKGTLSLSWLKKESVNFIPGQIDLMKALSGLKLKLNSAPDFIKMDMPILTPVKISLLGNEALVNRIPIQIKMNDNNLVVSKTETNENGLATCYLNEISSESKIIGFEASIDLAEYLDISKDDSYYTIASVQNPVNTLEFNIESEKPTICIQSTEKLYGKDMDIKTLEPLVKETLAAYGYNFVADKTLADYLIKIDANTTTGTEYEGIKFAYLDVNLSVVHVSDNEEVFKTHLDQIKGGGINKAKAGKKAYTTGSEKLIESLQKSMLVK